jgi:hypothetical protein
MKELKGLVLDLPRQRSVINDPQVREARALWHKKCGPAKYQTTNIVSQARASLVCLSQDDSMRLLLLKEEVKDTGELPHDVQRR